MDDLVNVRLVTLGSMEHNVIAVDSQIDKLRDLLKSNSGETFDLIWGPDLEFTDIPKIEPQIEVK